MAEISKTMRKNSSRDMRKNDITDVYLQLLTSGERNPPEEMWEAAWDLCEARYADAERHRESQTAMREVDLMRDFRPTVKGRLWAADMLERRRQTTMLSRIHGALKWLGGLLLACVTLAAGLATIAGYWRTL